jgi:hypothetical protein
MKNSQHQTVHGVPGELEVKGGAQLMGSGLDGRQHRATKFGAQTLQDVKGGQLRASYEHGVAAIGHDLACHLGHFAGGDAP